MLLYTTCHGFRNLYLFEAVHLRNKVGKSEVLKQTFAITAAARCWHHPVVCLRASHIIKIRPCLTYMYIDGPLKHNFMKNREKMYFP